MLVLTAKPSTAQTWPQRTVKFIVTLGPGSGVDIGTRLLADRLSRRWGQPVVVENRPGGDGLVAIGAFVGANDDHVLLAAPSRSFTAHPFMYKSLPSVDSSALAQSADLVLCDRVAADPTDPDKPKEVKGTAEIAQSDLATAIKFCKVASVGSRRALYQLGRAYAANRQFPEAMSAYRKAADKGSTSAMVELGVLLATGSGVAKDEALARKLFERAAAAGNPRGATNLAALDDSAGAPSDPGKTRASLAKAAETNSEAQYQLGMMIAEGVGGPKDDVAARALFEKAAAQDHPGALERMGAFAQSGRGGPQDAGAAKAYYEKAAALGNEDAKAALKRADCPIVLKDKRGNVVTHLCF